MPNPIANIVLRLATKGAAKELISGVGSAVGAAFSGVSRVGQALSNAGEQLNNVADDASKQKEQPKSNVIIANFGMASTAGQQKITGGGTLPAARNVSRPQVSEKMPTEALLDTAVKYLISIDKSLKAQLELEKRSFQEQAKVEREAAIEKPSAFSNIKDRLSNLKDTASQVPSTAATIAKIAGIIGLAGAAIASGLDETELAKLRENLTKFGEIFGALNEVAKTVYDVVGVEGLLGGYLLGWRGLLAGTIYNLIEEATGSAVAGAAGAAAGTALTTKTGRRLAGRGAVAAGRFLIANPFAALAGAVTGLGLYGFDKLLKYESDRVITPETQWYNQNGMYPKYSSDTSFPVVVGFAIRMPDRNINVANITVQQLRQNTRESDPYYYWEQVRLSGSNPRAKTELDANRWLRTRGQAWLDSKYPKVADATAAVPASAQPDAVSASRDGVSSASAGTSFTPGTTGQDKTITGVVDGGRGYTTVTYSDGTTERRTGTLPARTNNPGNIMYGDIARSYGAVGSSPSTNGPPVAVFPTPAHGFAAMDGLLTSNYSNGPIGETLGAWATDPTHPAKVLGTAGVDPSKRYTDFTDDEKTRFMQALAKVEGYYAAGSGPTVSSLPGMESSTSSGIGGLVSESLQTAARMFGALGSIVIKPGVPRTDLVTSPSNTATTINNESMRVGTDIALGVSRTRTQEAVSGAPTPGVGPGLPQAVRSISSMDPNYQSLDVLTQYLGHFRMAA